MQFKQITPRPLKGCLYALLLLISFSNSVSAQTTYLSQGDKAYILLERLEIKAQSDSILNFSKTRPYSRKGIVSAAELAAKSVSLNNKVEAYNLKSFFLNNIEWIPGSQETYKSKKSIGKNFYTTPANLYEVHVKDFDLIVNPVIQLQYSKEKDNDETLFFKFKRGGYSWPYCQ